MCLWASLVGFCFSLPLYFSGAAVNPCGLLLTNTRKKGGRRTCPALSQGEIRCPATLYGHTSVLRPDTFFVLSRFTFLYPFIYFFLFCSFPIFHYLSYRFVVWRDGVRITGSGEYRSGVCLQFGRRMAEGLLKDEFSPFFSGNVLYIRVLPGYMTDETWFWKLVGEGMSFGYMSLFIKGLHLFPFHIEA